MKNRLIERVYPDQDKTIYLLVEQHPTKRAGVILTEILRADTLADMQTDCKLHGYELPKIETWIYPDWPTNIEFYVG